MTNDKRKRYRIRFVGRWALMVGHFVFALIIGITPARCEDAANENSLNLLLITSGCCHDYDFQTKAMQLAFEKHGVKAVWTVVNDGGNGTQAEIDFYRDPSGPTVSTW